MALKYTKMERNWVMYDVGNSALVLLNTAVVPCLLYTSPSPRD